MSYLRHGDVNLHPISEIPATAKLIAKGKYILARGEATGSIHVIETEREDDLEIYQDTDGTIYVRNLAQAKISHTSDHETLVAEPDTRIQVPEREADHFGDSVIQKVVD